ncbi:MAG: hypothetical protein JO235_16400 [Chroococcidiopsidaceae cyanobacterium CP_BM_RX_35]|nr:hypothetical protein [Chroococcidiopsidaceae cyanobacterium CP_BM_RX_35]
MSKRKIHPNSLKNLTHQGRPLAVGEPKKPRQLTVSDTGWTGALSLAEVLGCSGVSDLLEKLGRNQLAVFNLEQLENRLDLQDALEALAESNERIPYEQVRQELGLTGVVQD